MTRDEAHARGTSGGYGRDSRPTSGKLVGEHLIDGQTAQDLLATYAERRRSVPAPRETGLSGEQRHEMAAYHQPSANVDYCSCGDSWPCWVTMLLEENTTLARQISALTEEDDHAD